MRQQTLDMGIETNETKYRNGCYLRHTVGFFLFGFMIYITSDKLDSLLLPHYLRMYSNVFGEYISKHLLFSMLNGVVGVFSHKCVNSAFFFITFSIDKEINNQTLQITSIVNSFCSMAVFLCGTRITTFSIRKEIK